MFGKKRREYKNLKEVRIELENYIFEKIGDSDFHFHKTKDIDGCNIRQRKDNGNFWTSDKLKNEEYHIMCLSVAFEKWFLEFEEKYKSQVKRYKRNNIIDDILTSKS